MNRSLQRVFNLQNQQIGISSTPTSNEKMIRNPYNAMDRRVVPGYETDYTWIKGVRHPAPNLSVITDQNANLATNNIRQVRKFDVPTNAIPLTDPRRINIHEV